VKSLIAALALALCLYGQDANAPNYSAAGIVNGASFTNGLSPNAIGSIFGTNLAWETRALRRSDIAGNTMPTSLGSVEVYFEGWPAFLFYTSPTQINFLVPSVLLPATFQFWVARQGTRGPIVTVTLEHASPALFQFPDGHIVSTHLDGSVVSNEAPAKAGEIIVLWATGLGNTNPDLEPGFLPYGAQWLTQMNLFGIRINGAPIDPGLILYAGVAPGYAGLYQINVRLPEVLPPNPEIRLTLGDTVSPAGLILAASNR